MNQIRFFGLFIFVFTTNACSGQKENKQMVNPYPFQTAEIEGSFSIVAAIESDELFDKYYTFFKKHGYEGNGPCWAGHIIQILELEDKELLSHIDFDPEAGAFFANVDSKENQIRFINLLSPIFSDLDKLGSYVKKADRSRIDD